MTILAVRTEQQGDRDRLSWRRLAERGAPRRRGTETARAKIMLIDDDRDLVCSLESTLERLGYSVKGFTDPSSAVIRYRPGGYDLVITDVAMPGMNGFEVYRELAKVDKDLSICFMTGLSVSKEELEKLFPDVRVTHLLRKPVSTRELKRMVDEMLEESARKEEKLGADPDIRLSDAQTGAPEGGTTKGKRYDGVSRESG